MTIRPALPSAGVRFSLNLVAGGRRRPLARTRLQILTWALLRWGASTSATSSKGRVGDRGELRDYVDLMEIERRTGLVVEEVVPLYLDRYGLDPAHESVTSILLALGHLDDVADDPGQAADGSSRLPEVSRYWRRRQPEVLQAFDPTAGG